MDVLKSAVTQALQTKKFRVLKKNIDEGLADSKTGRVHNADEVLAWIKQKIPCTKR